MLNWHKNSKNYKVQKNDRPQPDGVKNRADQEIRELKSMSTTPHTRTEPNKMTRSINGIQPRHHRHTPTTGHTPHSAQNEAGKHTHATKVHWHTIEFSNNTSTPTSQNQTAPAGKSGFVRSYTTNQPKVKLTLNPG